MRMSTTNIYLLQFKIILKPFCKKKTKTKTKTKNKTKTDFECRYIRKKITTLSTLESDVYSRSNYHMHFKIAVCRINRCTESPFFLSLNHNYKNDVQCLTEYSHFFQIFTANFEKQDRTVTITFPAHIQAQIIRIVALSWDGWPGLRMEILGCTSGKFSTQSHFLEGAWACMILL